MIIDTHIHEKTYSKDSAASLDDIVKRARAIGLGGVCITDHESQEIKDRAEEYSKETGFLIIVGAEVLTFEGDILVFGLNRLPNRKVYAQELIDEVQKVKGAAISAHPFRHNNRGMGYGIRNIKGLSGIEAFNGSTRPHDNFNAYELSIELDIPIFGASDAHRVEEIGKYATRFDGYIRDEIDFIEAIREGKTSAMIYKNNKFERIEIGTHLHIVE